MGWKPPHAAFAKPIQTFLPTGSSVLARIRFSLTQFPSAKQQGLYNSGVLFSCQRFYPKPRHPSLITCHSPSNPSNSSRAFARASRSQRQKSSKDIFVPPASSRARTGQHFDLCREQRAVVSRQEIRKFRPAFPACDLENLRTSRFLLVLAAKIGLRVRVVRN